MTQYVINHQHILLITIALHLLLFLSFPIFLPRKSFQPEQLDIYWENLVLGLIGETVAGHADFGILFTLCRIAVGIGHA